MVELKKKFFSSGTASHARRSIDKCNCKAHLKSDPRSKYGCRIVNGEVSKRTATQSRNTPLDIMCTVERKIKRSVVSVILQKVPFKILFFSLP